MTALVDGPVSIQVSSLAADRLENYAHRHGMTTGGAFVLAVRKLEQGEQPVVRPGWPSAAKMQQSMRSFLAVARPR